MTPTFGRTRAFARGRHLALSLCVLTAMFAGGMRLSAQEEAGAPELRGRVQHGGVALAGQTVVLHRVGSTAAGEIGRAVTGPAGGFRFTLPAIPDPDPRGDVYFVSSEFHGIHYFGTPVTSATGLDSLQVLTLYDTASAPLGGANIPLAVRNLFVEPAESGWRITDLFEVENAGARTLVARDAGVVWSYPLLPGARDVVLGEGVELAPDAFEVRSGRVLTRAPLPPGRAFYAFQYAVDELSNLPMPGRTQIMEVFLPAASDQLQVAGLAAAGPVELEPGVVFRRYTGTDLADARATFDEGEPTQALPLGWVAVLMALAMAVLGLWAVTGRGPRAA